jgi:membrane protease YdiL (CAAX protease family)
MTSRPPIGVRAILRSPYALGYLALFALLLFVLRTFENFSFVLPVFVFLFIGIGFSAVALFATRRYTAPDLPIRRPGLETLLLVLYLVFVVGGYLVWAMPRLGPTFEPGSAAHLVAVLGKKLLLFAVVPFLLFRFLWGYRLRDLADLSFRWKPHAITAIWVSLITLPFQMLLGGGLRGIGDAGFTPWQLIVGVPLTFLWVLVEVGIVEELPYRVLLQSRLAALLRSEVGAVFTMAVLFGLTHAPGLYFRSGGSIEALGVAPSPLMAIGYSIVIVSVVSLFLGFLWMRTRNLPLLMIVHAAFDWIPKIPDVAGALLR